MFTTLLSPEQWAEARRLRVEGASYAAVGRQLGVSGDTIAKRAHREGWPAPAGARTAPKLPADTAAVRRRLMHRLYRVMDLKLELMELRMQKQLKQAKKKDGDIPATDDEKDMRPLATVMKTIEQATELDPDLDRAAGGGARGSDSQARASEADAFRREIAERIEKLIPPS
jgi:hypothetical protein